MTQQRDLKIKKREKADQMMERKPYSKPQLIEYGHLEEMTQQGTGGGGDFRSRFGVRQS
jgi:hypothetical protein